MYVYILIYDDMSITNWRSFISLQIAYLIMRTVEEFAKALEDRNLSHVSRKTGIMVATLWKIKVGMTRDVRLSTAIALENYLNEHA